jgi:hypothetical protein
MHQVPEAQGEGKADGSSSPPSSDQKSVESNMQARSEAADFLTTTYRHETNENGNHVVIGREGDIRSCEDEVCIS